MYRSSGNGESIEDQQPLYHSDITLPLRDGNLTPTDPDRCHVIGRDGHLDQSNGIDLGQPVYKYRR